MKYALSVPNLGLYADPHLLNDLAQAAEETGWDGFFLWDHMLLNRNRPIPTLDPWVALAAIACRTERLALGPVVTPLARRRPWKVARESVTLDRLAGGRTVLGVGLGTPPEHEFGAFGEPTGDRLRAEMLDEALDVITALWSGEPVDHRGEHYHVDNATFVPTPVDRIPVWVAGKWPGSRPVRRAARWDGLVTMKAGDAYQETVEIPEIKRILALVRENRVDEHPFDLVLLTMNSWPDAPPAADPVAYEHAGVTWWLENLHPFAVEPATIFKLVSRGPGPLR